ncbi:MAG: TolC family protein [bacterium]
MLALLLALTVAAPDTLKLTLADAFALARRHSPDLVQADAARAQGGITLARGIAGLIPSVAATLGYGREDLGASIPESLRLTGWEWSGSLGLSQVVFDPSAFTGLAAAVAGAGSQRADARDREARLLYDVTADYLGLLRSGLLREASAAALARAEENLRIAEEMRHLGSASEIDVLRSSVFKSQADIELLQADKAVAVARATFAATVGLERDVFVRPVESLPGPADAPPPFAELHAAIQRSNPGLEIARRARSAADIGCLAAWGRALPGVSAYWTSSWADSALPRGIGGWTDRDVRTWGIRATFPLLDFKTWILGIADAGNESRRARAAARAAELQLNSSATAALLGYEEAIETWQLAGRSLELSQRLHELAREQRRLGSITLADFFGVEADLARARATLTGSLCDTYIQAARINYLLGVTDAPGTGEDVDERR